MASASVSVSVSVSVSSISSIFSSSKPLSSNKSKSLESPLLLQSPSRRQFLKGFTVLAPLTTLIPLHSPLPLHAKEVEVGSYLPQSSSDPNFVQFQASSKDTPALRAGNVQPYQFVLPPTWKQLRIANILSGNYCQPKCAEPWIEVKFEDEKQGKVQVVASPLIRLTNKPNATLEDIGSPEKVIGSLGPFVTGNTLDLDEELLETSVEKIGDQTFLLRPNPQLQDQNPTPDYHHRHKQQIPSSASILNHRRLPGISSNRRLLGISSNHRHTYRRLQQQSSSATSWHPNVELLVDISP